MGLGCGGLSSGVGHCRGCGDSINPLVHDWVSVTHLWHGSTWAGQAERGAHPPGFPAVLPQVDPSTGYIDYDRLEENARLFHPKLIIAGA